MKTILLRVREGDERLVKAAIGAALAEKFNGFNVRFSNHFAGVTLTGDKKIEKELTNLFLKSGAYVRLQGD